LWNEEGSNSKLVVLGNGHSKEIVVHGGDPMWGPFSIIITLLINAFKLNTSFL